MLNRKNAYLLMVLVTIVLIVYVIYANFVFDTRATGFLSRKMELKKALNIAVWLKVMHVHVAFACLAMIAGAINFSSWIFKKYRRFHRLNGYLYVVSVMIVDLTSGYMAPYATGGKISSVAFNLLNILWLLMTIMAIVKIRRKHVDQHRKWMIRSYAFVFTNFSIHLLTSFFHKGFGLSYANSYTISIYSSIILLLLVGEMVIRTWPKARI
ncbi:DUF2306 domain-containing protein [Paenibacillus sp. 5J-6]|uniref:DUF2306 domain-containing protein n=1 Tax=Paenibacillus silvestris TaxID=2606219 RepID=A0A6L8V6C7_9BACL|nr:DUF2306 domain-containing protein [Paenibacillus silvestris]MZQ85847.1 DUF2306 domain-containing protein [Paenibacillus silvestris]